MTRFIMRQCVEAQTANILHIKPDCEVVSALALHARQAAAVAVCALPYCSIS